MNLKDYHRKDFFERIHAKNKDRAANPPSEFEDKSLKTLDRMMDALEGGGIHFDIGDKQYLNNKIRQISGEMNDKGAHINKTIREIRDYYSSIPNSPDLEGTISASATFAVLTEYILTKKYGGWKEKEETLKNMQIEGRYDSEHDPHSKIIQNMKNFLSLYESLEGVLKRKNRGYFKKELFDILMKSYAASAVRDDEFADFPKPEVLNERISRLIRAANNEHEYSKRLKKEGKTNRAPSLTRIMTDMSLYLDGYDLFNKTFEKNKPFIKDFFQSYSARKRVVRSLAIKKAVEENGPSKKDITYAFMDAYLANELHLYSNKRTNGMPPARERILNELIGQGYNDFDKSFIGIVNKIKKTRGEKGMSYLTAADYVLNKKKGFKIGEPTTKNVDENIEEKIKKGGIFSRITKNKWNRDKKRAKKGFFSKISRLIGVITDPYYDSRVPAFTVDKGRF